MAIEKRSIKGRFVGYDTEKMTYCKLPKDWVDRSRPVLPENFDKMTVEELLQYAARIGVVVPPGLAKAEIQKLLKGE